MLQTFYYLVLYTSDDPVRFKYFSDPFTTRLNQESNIQFIEDRRAEDLFFVNVIKNKTGNDFDKIVQRGIALLKSKINGKQIQEALILSEKQLNFFEKNLMQYPYEISQNTLINFYFWNAIAHLDDKTKAQELLSVFLTHVTLEQRDFFESELSVKLFKKYEEILNSLKNINLHKYTIANMEKCEVFLNGVRLKQNTFAAPQESKNVLSAICLNGFYAQYVTSSTDATITLQPHFEKSLASKPAIGLFPISSIDRQKIKSIVLIYWSKKNNYIQTEVANTTNYADKRELILQLKTKEDLNAAGDKISRFIFTNDKPLVE